MQTTSTPYEPITILIPVDGSPLAHAAIGAALAVAPTPGSVTLLHVVDERGLTGEATLETVDALASDLRARAPGCQVETMLTHGDPVTEILDTAGRSHPDLIVMATRDFLAPSKPAASTVTAQVAANTSVPVLVAHPHREGWQPKRVLVPLDGSLRSLQALPIAAGLASRLSAPVHLVAVIDPESSLPPAYAWSCPDCDPDLQDALSYLQCQASDLLTQSEQRLRAAGVTVTSDLLLGKTSPVLIEAIQPSDLVVMTTRGAGRHSGNHVGSVATRMLRESPVPVVVFHPRLAATITHNPLGTDWESVIPTPHRGHR